MAVKIGRSMLAGFGLSAGHDAWRFTKRNSGTLLLVLVAAGAAYLPFKGMRELVRGHERGVVTTLWKTVATNLLVIAAGPALGFGLSLAVLLVFGMQWPAALVLAAILALGVAAGASVIGLLVGMVERPTRLRRFAIARGNLRFMSDIGLRKTGGTDVTHFDANGVSLRLLETHRDRLVFLVVGKRNKRAYIELDAEGRMLSYSGVTGH